MDKRIIIFVCLMILVGFVMFVSALGGVMTGGNDSPYNVEINVIKGWNIIAGVLPERAIASDSQIKATDIKSVWYYAPNLKKYVQIYPNLDMSAQIDDDVALTSAMWVYSDKSGVLKYNTLEDYMPLSMRELSAGYNFVTITPDMVNSNTASQGGGSLKMQDIIGNCHVEKSYLFDTENQEWVEFPIDEEFYSDFIGLGWVVKVTNDCNLGTSVLDTLPLLPEFENRSNITKFQRSDFPERIFSYSLELFSDGEIECDKLNGEDVCVDETRVEYVSDREKRSIHVIPVYVSKGRNTYEKYLNQSNVRLPNGLFSIVYELFWIRQDYIFFIQDYSYIKNPDGSIDISQNKVDTNNAVFQYFLERYPPIMEDCSSYNYNQSQCINKGCICQEFDCRVCWPRTNETVCTDSDGGLNYYVKGRTGSGANPDFTDYCSGDTLYMDTVVEYTCAGSDFTHVISNRYTCPDGNPCSNGACIK